MSIKNLVLLLALVASILLTTTTNAKPSAAPGGKYFDHVFIIMFENFGIDDTLKHDYFKALTTNGTLLTQFYAVTHPSQPNYIAQIAGSFFNVRTDYYVTLNQTNLADLMEAKGYTWKSYQEDLPREKECFDGVSYNNLYYRKHNPFIMFEQIRSDRKRCANIVHSDQLEIDHQNDELPNLMYYTPNINNDGHDTGLEYADKYLRNFLPHYLNSARFMKRTLVVVTFDEDDYSGDNRIYTLLTGSMVKGGVTDNTVYNHYSLTRTIEENWGLGNMGRNDANATPFQCFVNNEASKLFQSPDQCSGK